MSSFRQPRGFGVRRWLLVGLFGVLVVLCLAPLYDAWVTNQAGVLINRVMLAASTADETGSLADADPAACSAANLAEAMALMESALLRGSDVAARDTPMWRTYGAAAALAPSERAFQALVLAREMGQLDRLGQLWLGEVASATEHWEEAAAAYRRIDASNVLISRADAYLEAGDKDRAIHQYSLAKISLDAAIEREAAERVTALYRIGRGLHAAGEPLQAIAVLEEAREKAAVTSPGAVVEQSLCLNLALALAETLPDPPLESFSYLQALVRIRTLVYQGIRSNLTASVCVQAGRVLLLTNDEEQATSLLRQALELDPLLPDAYLALGAWYESKGMKVLPFRLYEQGAQRLPADLRLAAAHAISAYKVLPPAEALPLLEGVAQTETADPYLFAFLGDCYLDLNLRAEARSAYEEGLRRAPGAKPLASRMAGLRATAEGSQ
jgi:tetratricopeptide (TPR) repeat protein